MKHSLTCSRDMLPHVRANGRPMALDRIEGRRSDVSDLPWFAAGEKLLMFVSTRMGRQPIAKL